MYEPGNVAVFVDFMLHELGGVAGAAALDLGAGGQAHVLPLPRVLHSISRIILGRIFQ